LRYFPRELGDKLKQLDDYIQWHCFSLLPLGNYHSGNFAIYILVASAKKKKRREERKKTCSLFLGFINLQSFYSPVVIFFYSFQFVIILLFQNFVKKMYNVLMINKAQVFFLY
jgi:hypothetical protein